MLLANRTENVFTIQYLSALFPYALKFNGFFNEVLEFSEDARKPNSRDYSFSFTVTSTSPDLDEALAMVAQVKNRLELEPSEEARVFGPNTLIISP
jgi:hypothetical protein